MKEGLDSHRNTLAPVCSPTNVAPADQRTKHLAHKSECTRGDSTQSLQGEPPPREARPTVFPVFWTRPRNNRSVADDSQCVNRPPDQQKYDDAPQTNNSMGPDRANDTRWLLLQFQLVWITPCRTDVGVCGPLGEGALGVPYTPATVERLGAGDLDYALLRTIHRPDLL